MKSGLLEVLRETKGRTRVPLSVGHFQCWHAAAQQDIESLDMQKLGNAAEVLFRFLLFAYTLPRAYCFPRKALFPALTRPSLVS